MFQHDVAGAETSVLRCLGAIRKLILSGALLPGEKVHQSELAEQLNVSRIPLREALSTLAAEGVLDYKPNTGYRVSRFSSDDLSEIYLMRRLLETEILRSIDLAEVDVPKLVRLNGELRQTDPDEEQDRFQELNSRFHFALFEYSPLKLIREEVSRLWYMSSFYRSLYLHEIQSSHDIVVGHEQIIQAVRNRDARELVRTSDEHRLGTENIAVRRLGPTRRR
ncbi:GntR family transcriptional regulator [Blastococcus tunisiensis]|uniref:DNA-binding transcriptional regulator, GntR family n=1 Tax=Blastococcus tunisiensis TaxID=1798228 RepID=A0A1I1ZTK7_9ACTN|nr:GntR family transcriptional regulator [Blastococcus sp. DSM 46838]SFE34986.1 DNA-binding transcriptional regulator, GntR family [Blastococcus sp. DSM 46838]